MKKNTTTVKIKKDVTIFIIAIVIIGIGAIASFLCTNVNDFLIYYSISIIGTIIGKSKFSNIKSYMDKRDNLD